MSEACEPREPRPFDQTADEPGLEARLALEPVYVDLEAPSWSFQTRGLPVGTTNIFGGMFLAQGLRAAQATVEAPLWPNALHGNFLQRGRPSELMTYEVERTRDGSSFATRRILCTQPGAGPVFAMTVSFHGPEEGMEYALAPPLDAPGPDACPEGRYSSSVFESRDVPVGATATSTLPLPRLAWFHCREALADDPSLHLQGLAFLSDHGPTRAAREPHSDHPGVERRMSVSLDHAVWFHRPVRVDQWLLYELSPISTQAARGLVMGWIRTADGTLAATVTQEALLRLPD